MSNVNDWDYDLPDASIARYPAGQRDGSRLLHLPIAGGALRDHGFSELPSLLEPGDLLVVNATRVMAARLRGVRPTGGAAELLILEAGPGVVRALARPAKKLRPGSTIALNGGGIATIVGPGHAPGEVLVTFDRPVVDIMEEHGEMPLPPYLQRDAEPSDRQRYQTIYADQPGSAAAPTAGLHFSNAVIEALKHRNIGVARVTLHVGLGTFRPVTDEDMARGTLHQERYSVPESTAQTIETTRRAGGRVIAVGTTSARTLESATPNGASRPDAGDGATTLFIQPPYAFKAIDGLITNFHLPKSSLLMLVASLCDRQRLQQAYAHAIERGYRFYSYGDAMLLL